MMMYNPPQRGFTLMELLKTVGIIGIVMSFGVPSMTSLVRSNEVVTYTNDFISTVHMARAEALNGVVQTTVCKSTDQISCSDAAAWDDGWIVFVDNNEDEIRDLGGTPEILISAHPALDGPYTMQSAAFSNWVAFRPNGLATGSAGNAGTFSLCTEGSVSDGRDIGINRTGSTVVGPNATGACP